MAQISVIMPVYNGAQYISETIDSLLNQSFSKFELIVIDDCSTDETEAIIKSKSDPRIRYFRTPSNVGDVWAFQFGLERASAEIIARADADDIVLPWRLEFQYGFLQQHPSIDMVCSKMINFSGAVPVFPTLPISSIFSKKKVNLKRFAWAKKAKVDLIFDSVVANPTVIARRPFFTKAVYPPELRYCGDYLLWTQTVGFAGIFELDFPTVLYRLHANQMLSRTENREVYVTRNVRIPYLRSSGCDFSPEQENLVYQFYCGGISLDLGGMQELYRLLLSWTQSFAHPGRRYFRFRLWQKFQNILSNHRGDSMEVWWLWLESCFQRRGGFTLFLRWLLRAAKRRALGKIPQ